MVKVGIISDTHGWLREDVKKQLADCDYIIHAGDIDKEEIIEQLREIAPLYIVKGNADKNIQTPLNIQENFVIEGISFELVHHKKMLAACQPDTQIVVYGHTHKYAMKRDGHNVLWLNPGCCGKRRIHQEVTMMRMIIENGKYEVERIVLEQGNKTEEHSLLAKKSDMLAVIQEIVKRMERSEPMEQIAQKIGVPQEFVEMIYRIKVTHPGVTCNGIYDKLEVNETIKREFLK